MSKIQQYLYNSSYVTIWGEVKDHPDMVIISENGDYGELIAVNKKDLQKVEDSWKFKNEKERAEEIRLITAKAQENFDRIVEKVIKKAVGALSARMKFNILFGDNMKSGGWALQVAEELNKLVKEEAEEVVKGIEK